ncbi:hypothetical protein D3C72_2572310 [compost metagenome]
MKYALKAGDAVEIPHGAKHAVKATSPLEYIEIQIGSRLAEEDAARLTKSWEEAVRYLRE